MNIEVRTGQIIVNSIWDRTPDQEIHFLQGDLKAKRAEAWVVSENEVELSPNEETLNVDKSSDEMTMIIVPEGYRFLHAQVSRYTFSAVVISEVYYKRHLHRDNIEKFKYLFVNESI